MPSHSLRRPVTLILIGVLAFGAPLALSGCSLIGGAVNGATGGGVSLPGTSIPDDFPKDVPLIDGDVQVAVAGGNEQDGKAWNITIKTKDTDAAATIKSQMTDAGFDSQGDGATTEGTGGAYTKDKLTVVVVVGADKDDVLVNYTVAQDK